MTTYSASNYIGIDGLTEHVEQIHEFCQHMSNKHQKDEGFSLYCNIALTINTAKSLTSTQKLQNFICCHSISCLSLCLDQLCYISQLVVEMHLAVGFIYILILILANENYLALVYGVVAPFYQRHKQGATTLHNKSQ